MEDAIKFVCDGCGENKRVKSVCKKAGDAIYCSKTCRNEHYFEHVEICCCDNDFFLFCNYCDNRVIPDDLCPCCGLMYVCGDCTTLESHVQECGKVGLNMTQVENVVKEFRNVKINGEYLSTIACEIGEREGSPTHLLILYSDNGIIDYGNAKMVSSTEKTTKFHKFLMMEVIRETEILFQTRSLEFMPKFPLAIKVNDKITDQTLFEFQSTILP